MKRARKIFMLVGLMLGIVQGIYPIVMAYKAAPTAPGVFELGLQLLIIGFFGLTGCVVGLLVSFPVLFLVNKIKKTRSNRE